jgi:predicted secreted protein
VKNGSQEAVKNGEWIKSCLEHFLRGEALISPVEKKELQTMMTKEATAEEVYDYIKKMFGQSEKIYSYSTEKDKTHLIPSVERMKEILAKVDAMPVEASYPEFRKIDISVNPDAGRIVATEGNEKDGEVWTLSNGARIIRMQTEPVKSSNHMVIKATFNTGFTVFPEKHMECSRIAASYIDRNFGFRKYSRKDLRDSPETGDVSMTVEIGKEESAISVTCSKNDVEKAFRNSGCVPKRKTA